MNLGRILSISKKNALTVFRQKRTIALLFIAPLVAMFLFGYAFNGHAHNVPMIVVNDDQGAINPVTDEMTYVSQLVIANVNDQPPDDVEYTITNMTNLDAALSALNHGTVIVVVYFGPSFSANTFANVQNHNDAANATVVAWVDNSELTGGDSTPGAIQGAVAEVDAILGQQSANAVNISDRYGSYITFMDYFIPGIIAFVTYFLPALMTLLLFVGETSGGTYERLLSTPLTEGELVIGYAITFGALSIVQSLILFFAGVAAFNIVVNGSGFILALLFIIVEAIGAQAFGIMMSGLAKRADQAVAILPFIVIPALLLTGVLIEVSVLPLWLQPFSYILPPTYTTTALRDILIKGWEIAQVWPYMLVLIGFAALFLLGSTLIFKRKKHG
jgi:ABC-2 type transport system permease protein